MKRKTTATIVALTLLIFGGGVALVTLRLRARIRAEVTQREAAILSAVAQREARQNGQTLLDLVLGVVDLDGVIGVRLFDTAGRFVRALPDNLTAGTLDQALLHAPHTTSRLTGEVRLYSVYADPFGELGDRTLPLLNVVVPVRGRDSQRLLGFAEFLVDGRTTLDAFRRLDRDLLRQALSAFGGGGLLIVAILLYSLRQLEAKNRDLAAANRQLTLHAKTAVIGALSSHLFHRLQNALAGLHLAMRENGDALPDACASAARIQQMVQEVIDVIKEEEYGITYDISTREILELVVARTLPGAAPRHVRVQTRTEQDRRLANRDANLLLLALQNLVSNAIEASPAGGVVECAFREDAAGSRFTVTDQGDGIPEARRGRLFEPGDSAKAGGSGIGLCISHQLCRHLGGELRLSRTGPAGTVFELLVPRAALR